MPGVSVLTPKRGREGNGSASARSGGRGKTPRQQQDLEWDSESEEGEGEDGGMMGFSPPKTMQFHIPQGRLMRTPGMFYVTYISPSLSWIFLGDYDHTSFDSGLVAVRC